MKVAELEGALLDYWVARALGYKSANDVPSDLTGEWSDGSGTNNDWTPSADWAQGGPIIEREQIAIVKFWDQSSCPGWSAHVGLTGPKEIYEQSGGTPLIAAMRAYVTSKFGDEVSESTI